VLHRAQCPQTPRRYLGRDYVRAFASSRTVLFSFPQTNHA
jgi:hypothetical protein